MRISKTLRPRPRLWLYALIVPALGAACAPVALSSDASAAAFGRHMTATTVRCSPNSVNTSTAVDCIASVVDTSGPNFQPSGVVSFTSSGAGTFSPGSCVLTSEGEFLMGATCSSTFTPSASGADTVSATYEGGVWADCPPTQAAYCQDTNGVWSSSTGATPVTVSDPGPAQAPTTTQLSCSPNPIINSATCAATVADARAGGPPASGTVFMWDGGCASVGCGPKGFRSTQFPSGNTCALSAGTCQVTVTLTCGGYVDGCAWTGIENFRAAYEGDPSHASSSATTNATVAHVEVGCYPLCGL